MTTTTPPVPVRDGRVDTKDTAKLVRARLKAAFPGVTFSVRISRYSGGSSVTVDWRDGPTETAVRAITDVYSGVGYDGMTDSTTYNSAWLWPDGTATQAMTGRNGWGGYRVNDADGDPVAETDRHDYRAGQRIGAGVDNTTLHGVNTRSAAYRRGLADGESTRAKGARLVSFGGTVMTQRRLSDEYAAELGQAVLFLARGEPAGPFDGNARYDLAVGLPGPWEDYGHTLAWRLAGLDDETFDATMQNEAERRAYNAAVRFNTDNSDSDGRVTGFYVTAIDGRKVAALLGPFATRDAAEADVGTGRRLARQVDPLHASFAGFGVTRATSRPGEPLPGGKLEALPARQLALAGLA
jgi:hypothetical protein